MTTSNQGSGFVERAMKLSRLCAVKSLNKDLRSFHAASEALRSHLSSHKAEADATVARLEAALRSARTIIAGDRAVLIDCHTNPATQQIPANDRLGNEALREYDEVLAQIDAALAARSQEGA